jgi:hypothetical protein
MATLLPASLGLAKSWSKTMREISKYLYEQTCSSHRILRLRLGLGLFPT